eukprot:3394362-Amphidinium_carterae.1
MSSTQHVQSWTNRRYECDLPSAMPAMHEHWADGLVREPPLRKLHVHEQALDTKSFQMRHTELYKMLPAKS